MNGTVLVVDDDAAVLDLTALFLTKNGFTVYTAASAASALEKSSELDGRIDLLIADLELPDGSGIEVARQIKAVAPRAKTLFVSGYPIEDRGNVDAALVSQLGNGSVEFLSKPYSGPELMACVTRLLDNNADVADAGITGVKEPAPHGTSGAFNTLEGQAGMLDLVHDAVIVRDLDGRILYWNHGAETLYGWSKEQASGAVADDLLFTVFPCPVENILAALRETQCWEGELYQTVRNGRTVVVATRWAMREVGDGQVEILQLDRDITDQKKVEDGFRGVNHEMQLRLEELRRAENMSLSLLESAPDAMVITDMAGRIVLVNTQAEKQFGYSRDELLGQHVEMLMPRRVRDRHHEHRAGYTAKPRVRHMGEHGAFFGLRKSGEEFPVEISLSAIETGTGMLIISAIRDVTDRKRLERLGPNRAARAEGSS